MRHPDAPEEVTGDPDAYARWRVEHQCEEDIASTTGMSLDEKLSLYQEEFWYSMQTEEEAEQEDADIENHRAKREAKLHHGFFRFMETIKSIGKKKH